MLLSAILGYGYALLHGTCGIDDISIDLYFESGIGVAIGRWPYYLINKIIPIAKYTPFLGDAVTVLLLMASAVAGCVWLRMLTQKEMHISTYIGFSAFFLCNSMNADIFVFYLQNGIGWVWLGTILSLIIFFYIYKNNLHWKEQLIMRIAIIIMLTISISFYESAANIFLTGALLGIFIDLYEERDKSVFRGIHFISSMVFVARYLIYAMVARRIIRAVIMRVFSIPAYIFYRSATNITWLTKGGVTGIVEAIKGLLSQLYRDYFAMAVTYYPILLFVICTIVFGVYLLWSVWKAKDGMLLLTGTGVYVSLFVLCIIEGEPMLYRACQPFVLFVAYVFFVSINIIITRKNWIKQLELGAVAVCLLLSIRDMNKWFELDYDKTQYEMGIIDEIEQELASEKYNTDEKPIVIVGKFDLPEELLDRYCIKEGETGWNIVKSAVEMSNQKVTDSYVYGQNSASILDWSVHAFARTCGYNVPIKQLFEYRGYNRFKWAEPQTVEKVFSIYYPLDWDYYSYTNVEVYTEQYDELEQYPYDGYIEELEDCIVIKI